MDDGLAVFDSIHKIDPCVWNDLVTLCCGTIFFRWHFLAAFEKFPLLPVESFGYIVSVSDNRINAAIPAFLQTGADPLGALQSSAPGELNDIKGKGLWSNHWNCYDTRLLIDTLNKDDIDAIFLLFKSVAQSFDAGVAGFVNVPSEKEAKIRGLVPVKTSFPLWERYCMKIEYKCMSEYIEDLPKKTEMRPKGSSIVLRKAPTGSMLVREKKPKRDRSFLC